MLPFPWTTYLVIHDLEPPTPMRFLTALLLLAALVVPATAPAQSAPAKKDTSEPIAISPHAGLTPRDAVRAMTVPKGFQVQLVAGEPEVHQPVAMAIDHRGRLWIAEAYTYPQRAPEGKGKDRIVIFEDTNGDGTPDKPKVFIEGLNLVSGLEVGFGGVYVGAPPYLLFIPDKDGDDKPDGPPMKAEPVAGVRFPKDVPPGATVLLDGFGYEDTHETLNSFIWGPDGWLYGCHGVFTHSKVGKPGTPAEKRTPLNAGVWRYHPTRHEFEVFAHGTSNPWGVDFDDYGQAFVTACVIPHLFHVVQGGRYQRQAGQHFNPHTYDDIKTIADHAHYAGNIADHAWWGRDEHVAHATTDKAGGGHAHCGAMIYLGDNWPEKYRNTIFMNNVHGNRVNNDILKRRGSGYVGSHGDDFLMANDRWFRGINMRYGPDGGVYLIDWYDKNACHRGNAEIWDRTSGRIYKITYGTPKAVKVDLGKMSDEELVDLQLHKNDWYVRTARRVLQERAATRKLKAETKDRLLKEAVASRGEERLELRKLWAWHVTGQTEFADWFLLCHPSRKEHVRAWGIQLLLEYRQTFFSDRVLRKGNVRKFAAASRSEQSPVVRSYLASSLQRLPLAERWEIADGLLQHPEDAQDQNLPLMIWYGVEPLVVEDTPRAIKLAKDSKIPLVSRFIYRRAAADAKALLHVLAALGATDNESTQGLILDEIVSTVKARGRLAMPEAWPSVYERLAKSNSETIRRQAQFITVKFGDKSIFPALRGIVGDAKADLPSRQQALEALLAGKDEALPPVLHQLLDDAALRGVALRALATFAAADTPKAIFARYKNFSPDERQDAIATLAAREPYALALIDAIERGDVPRTDLTAFSVRQMQRFENKELLAKLTKVWGAVRSTPENKQKQIAQYKQKLNPGVLAKADLSHGRDVFKRTCAYCHQLFGDGRTVGPDLTGSNRANLDYILENVLDPSAVVGRDYQMTQILTKDGRLISGLIKEENESAVTVQAANDVVVVPKEDIDKRVRSEQSIMPEGQLQPMAEADVRDLVAYLASPRQVPLPGQVPAIDPKTGRVPGAIEGETMKILAKTGGDARSQKMQEFAKGRWSGADQLWWTGAKPGDRLTLELPVPADGRYEVNVVLTKARDYGVVQLSLDNAKVGQSLDLYNNPDVITSGIISLGTHELKKGPHRLTIEIVGAHPKAIQAHMFGLDYVYLAKPLEDKPAKK
jgi:putative membrane-bound dehydrogenase-like protein